MPRQCFGIDYVPEFILLPKVAFVMEDIRTEQPPVVINPVIEVLYFPQLPLREPLRIASTQSGLVGTMTRRS